MSRSPGGSASGEERLGRGLTEVCLPVRGGSASCAGGSAPFAEAGFKALSAPKVVALLGIAPLINTGKRDSTSERTLTGRKDTAFKRGGIVMIPWYLRYFTGESHRM